MAQITWKNVDAPDFKAAMLGTDAAVQTINGAFDPLDHLLKERKSLNEENWNTGIKNNDIEVQSQLQGFKNLAALNQADDSGQLNLDAFKQKFGAQYSADKLQPQITDARKTLQTTAMNSIMPEVNAYADENLSLVDSVNLFEKQAAAAGMRPEEIKKRSAEIMNDPAREALYTKTLEDNTRKLLGEIGIPKTEKEISSFIDQADATGIKYNRESFMKRLEQEKQGAQSDLAAEHAQTKYDHDTAEYNRTESNRKNSEALFNKSMTAFKTTGDQSASIRSIIDSGQNPEVVSQVLSQMAPIVAQATNLTPAETMNIERKTEAAKLATDQHIKNTTTVIEQLKQEHKNVSPITADVTEALSASRKRGEHFLDFETNNKEKAGFFYSIFNVDNKNRLAAEEVLDKKVGELMNLGVKSREDAQAIIHVAMERSHTANYNWGSGTQGVDPHVFQKQVEEVTKEYGFSKALETEIGSLTKQLDSEVMTMNKNTGDFLSGLYEQTVRQKVTGNKTPIKDFIKGYNIDAPNADPLPNSAITKGNEMLAGIQAERFKKQAGKEKPKTPAVDPGIEANQKSLDKAASLSAMNPSDIKNMAIQSLLPGNTPSKTPMSIIRGISNSVGAGNINKKDPMTKDFRSGETELIRALRLSGIEDNYEKASEIEVELKAKYPQATDTQIAEMILKSSNRVKK